MARVILTDISTHIPGNAHILHDLCNRVFSDEQSESTSAYPYWGAAIFFHRERSNINTPQCTYVEELTFSCRICSKSFRVKIFLKAHPRVHTGERPYSCDVCRKSFITKSYLSKHQHIHGIA